MAYVSSYQQLPASHPPYHQHWAQNVFPASYHIFANFLSLQNIISFLTYQALKSSNWKESGIKNLENKTKNNVSVILFHNSKKIKIKISWGKRTKTSQKYKWDYQQ